MSSRKGGLPPEEASARTSGISALLSLVDLGRQVIALNEICEGLDGERTPTDRYSADENKNRRARAAETGYQLAFDQTEALVDLGLLLVPQTLADVAAQLSILDRRMDLFHGSVVSEDEMSDFLASALHVIRSSLPVIAEAAQIGLGEVYDRWEAFCSAERPKIWAGDR